VHVPTAVLRDVEHRLRQQQAVGDDHDQVRRQRPQLRLHRLRAQRGRLEHLEPARQRVLLDPRHAQAAAAPRRPVGLGVDADDLGLAGGRAQRGHGELGGAGEDDLHWS
jgi:hypothetical protein